MMINEIKTEIRKIEKYYDFNHQTNDYDVLVNLTEIANLILLQNKISYNKVYLTLLKFESNGWVEHGLARGREKAYILTDKGIKLLNEIIGGEY